MTTPYVLTATENDSRKFGRVILILEPVGSEIVGRGNPRAVILRSSDPLYTSLRAGAVLTIATAHTSARSSRKPHE